MGGANRFSGGHRKLKWSQIWVVVWLLIGRLLDGWLFGRVSFACLAIDLFLGLHALVADLGVLEVLVGIGSLLDRLTSNLFADHNTSGEVNVQTNHND